MKQYLAKNSLSITAIVVFITSCLVIPNHYYIYTNFLLYSVLLIHVIARKDFCLATWRKELKNGKKFWKYVILTTFFAICAFAISVFFESILPNLPTEAIRLRVNNYFELLLFILSTIFLPAIVEEPIFRKNMIYLKNTKTIIITTVISACLFASIHFLSVWGIFLGIIWALPFSIAYIKTKNLYVPMTAHLICSVLANSVTIITTFLALASN